MHSQNLARKGYCHEIFRFGWKNASKKDVYLGRRVKCCRNVGDSTQSSLSEKTVWRVARHSSTSTRQHARARHSVAELLHTLNWFWRNLNRRISHIIYPQGADTSPLPLHAGNAGKNHLNEEITPCPPHWDIAKPYQMQRSFAVVNYPCKRKYWTSSGGPLVNSLLIYPTQLSASSIFSKVFC